MYTLRIKNTDVLTEKRWIDWNGRLVGESVRERTLLPVKYVGSNRILSKNDYNWGNPSKRFKEPLLSKKRVLNYLKNVASLTKRKK